MNRLSNTSCGVAPLQEAIPPKKQWNPVVLSGVKRVKAGEDPDVVALDVAMRVPGFTRTQLGAYTAAYSKTGKKVKEGFFSAAEPDIAARDNKEQAVQALLGTEDVDVKKVPDEELSSLIQGLGSITTESIDSQVAQIISVMREQHASRNDVLEALRVHVGFNLREAKEVLQEHLKEATTDITYYANYLRKQFQGLSFTVADLDKDMVIHVLAAFQYYFDKEEDPDSAMKILSKKWTTGEWGYTSSRGKIPGAKEAKALPKVVRWYNDFLEDREENLNIRESTEYPSEEFARALNKARVAGLSIPDLDALYDMVYDRISEEGEAFKDVLRYKATEKDIYDTIADFQD